MTPSARNAPCPTCGARVGQACKGIIGSHPERVLKNRWESARTPKPRMPGKRQRHHRADGEKTPALLLDGPHHRRRVEVLYVGKTIKFPGEGEYVIERADTRPLVYRWQA